MADTAATITAATGAFNALFGAYQDIRGVRPPVVVPAPSPPQTVTTTAAPAVAVVQQGAGAIAGAPRPKSSMLKIGLIAGGVILAIVAAILIFRRKG